MSFLILNKQKSKLEYNFLQYQNNTNQMIKLEHKRIRNYIMFTNKKVVQLKHSCIFLGLNTQNKKKVLIKVILKSQYENNNVLMNSFNFEVNAMKMLNQECILKSLELIMTEKNYYLILEEPQGHSIKKVLVKNGLFKEKDFRGYLKKIRPTFAALQKNSIIHGNINSKSVLIDHSQIKLGYPSYVKTIQVMKTNALNDADFSMGDSLQKQKEYSYLPPELLATGMVSLKHDIWSLGVVVYQALFGCLPWNIVHCDTPIQMASLILNERINFPKDVKISKQMKHFILNCLQTDPLKRFGWDDVLEHTVFNNDCQRFEQRSTDQQQACCNETKPFQWSFIQLMTKTNSTFSQ